MWPSKVGSCYPSITPAHDLEKRYLSLSSAVGPRGRRCVAVLGWRASCHRLTITSATLPLSHRRREKPTHTKKHEAIHRVNRNPSQQPPLSLGRRKLSPFHPANPPNKPVTNVRYTLLAGRCHRRQALPQCGRWHYECENFDTVSQPRGTTQ